MFNDPFLISGPIPDHLIARLTSATPKRFYNVAGTAIKTQAIINLFKLCNHCRKRDPEYDMGIRQFPSINGPFSQFRRQSAESLVRPTKVRLRAIP
jgi:hypothetical protein